MDTINILAADDEPFNLDLIELAFLDNPNVNITNAINGQNALDKLPESNADVIFYSNR